nr:site-specific DNA-methyltransferase [Mycoplasma miroungigenitalium]
MKNGEKDDIAASKFIYRDKFSRTGWLNMMSERLRMAKDLLKEDGVIFVSIDDTEQAYLKVLMDEIFGEENFVSSIVWKKHNSQNDAVYIESNHEYIICFSKNKSQTKLIKNKIDNKSGKSFSLLLGNTEGGRLNNRYKMGYTVYWNKSTGDLIPLHDYDLEKAKTSNDINIYKDNKELLQQGYTIIRPPKTGNYILRWKWNIDNFLRNKEKVVVKTKKDGTYTLHYLDERNFKFVGNKSIIENISSSLGSRINREVEINFTNPKPIELIKHILKMFNNNSRVLDFFAGSGTTGHAVMELNREDGGNRTFTLVTNNENNIAYDVTYERLYRINNGKGTKEESFKWLEKNKPYKQNLNVFNIEYFDTKLFDDNVNNELIKQTLIDELQDNGITTFTKFEKQLYFDLMSLKPLDTDKENENGGN